MHVNSSSDGASIDIMYDISTTNVCSDAFCLMQDSMVAAAALLLFHVGAYFQADDVIMREIPGSHPYLTGLGILGGMYSFDNPLQGDALLFLLPLLTSVCCPTSTSSILQGCFTFHASSIVQGVGPV